MPRFQKDITVAVTPQQAFAYLSDFTRHNEWTQHDVQIEAVAGEGTTFKSKNRFMGQAMEDTLKVTEDIPGQRIVYEADGDTGGFRHTFEIAPFQRRVAHHEEYRASPVHDDRRDSPTAVLRNRPELAQG